MIFCVHIQIYITQEIYDKNEAALQAHKIHIMNKLEF